MFNKSNKTSVQKGRKTENGKSKLNPLLRKNKSETKLLPTNSKVSRNCFSSSPIFFFDLYEVECSIVHNYLTSIIITDKPPLITDKLSNPICQTRSPCTTPPTNSYLQI